MRYRLSDADRERLGLAEEWVSFDPTQIMMSEAEGLEDAGYEVDQFLDDLQGREVYDRQNNPVLVPVLEEDGSQAVDAAGEPVTQVKRRFVMKALRAAVWIGLRRNGCDVAFDGFDFDITGVRIQADVPKDDPEPDPASPS